MKQHRILALFLSVLLLEALLAGCGTSSKNMAADTASPAAQNWKTESAAAAEEWGYDTPAEAPAETETAWDDAADTGFTTSAAGKRGARYGRQFLALGLRGEDHLLGEHLGGDDTV